MWDGMDGIFTGIQFSNEDINVWCLFPLWEVPLLTGTGGETPSAAASPFTGACLSIGTHSQRNPQSDKFSPCIHTLT